MNGNETPWIHAGHSISIIESINKQKLTPGAFIHRHCVWGLCERNRDRGWILPERESPSSYLKTNWSLHQPLFSHCHKTPVHSEPTHKTFHQHMRVWKWEFTLNFLHLKILRFNLIFINGLNLQYPAQWFYMYVHTQETATQIQIQNIFRTSEGSLMPTPSQYSPQSSDYSNL